MSNREKLWQHDENWKRGAKPEEQRKRGGRTVRGSGEGNVEKRIKKGDFGWKIVWVCDLCLGSSVFPGEASY